MVGLLTELGTNASPLVSIQGVLGSKVATVAINTSERGRGLGEHWPGFCRASEQNCEQRFGPISRQLLSRYSAMFEPNYLKFQTNHIAEAGLPTTIDHNYFQLGPLCVPAWELLCTSRSKFCQQRNYLEVLALILVRLSLKFGTRSYRALPTFSRRFHYFADVSSKAVENSNRGY